MWRDELARVVIDGKSFIGASFRGAAFFVEESARSGGRRTVTHEFPQRDDPFVEDLGRRARKFPITGYVIGDGYLAKKEALLTALEADGVGQLVHPYYGTRRAICDTYTVRETIAGAGMATFQLDFLETPVQTLVPVAATDSVGKLASSANATRAAVKLELAAKFSPLGMPAFGLTSAENALKTASAALTARLGPVITTTQELASLNSQAALITARAAALVRAPDTILDLFGGAITSLVATSVAAPGAMLAALAAVYDDIVTLPVRLLTATRIREAANLDALGGALRRVAAIEAARLSPTVPYVSIEDATAARDLVTSRLDEQALGAGDTAYPALVTLRSDVARAVPGDAALARVVTVTRRTAIPSLLLTYQLYGSVDLEADVLARNGVSHPGFLVGDLKVLSNG
jgi:prophage DNA circulation protein